MKQYAIFRTIYNVMGNAENGSRETMKRWKTKDLTEKPSLCQANYYVTDPKNVQKLEKTAETWNYKGDTGI